MKNKFISVSIILMLIFTSLISVDAIASTPRIELNDYEFTINNITNINISGTCSICKGQMVGVFDSTGKIPYAYTVLGNSSSKESFKLQIPERFISEGTNTFKVKSLPVKNVINGSNPKTVTVKFNSSKLDQVITASNLSIKVNEKKNINAKVSSNLPLTYVPKNPDIATVDATGTVIGRNKGTTSIVISQAGNSTYKPASKSITVTVKENSSPSTPSSGEITTNFEAYQFGKIDQNINVGAKTKVGTLIYKSSNPKIATVDSKGTVTAKRPGIAIVRVSLKNTTTYKNITISVPKTPNDRVAALQPWYKAMSAQKKAQNKRPALYNWSKWHSTGYSLEGSEKYGTCITFPSASLQRAGLLKKGEYLTAQDGKKFNGSLKRTSIKFLKRHPGYFKWYDNNTSLKKGVAKGKILPGDVIHYYNHTLVYWGKEKGNLYISEAGRWKSKKYNYAHTKYKTGGKTKVGWINRINCYNITTTCINGTISPSNLYMAGQNIKVSYTPIKGKKIKSIKVDGRLINSTNYKTSYTFKKLNKNHTIEITYQ